MSKGSVTIARYIGAEEGVHIEFTDDKSRVRFATMTLTLENFARVVMGQGCVEAELETRALDLVGKTSENKLEVIKVDPPYGDAKKLAILKAAVLELEVNGWKHRSGDMTNSHNYKKDGIHIVFFRHV